MNDLNVIAKATKLLKQANDISDAGADVTEIRELITKLPQGFHRLELIVLISAIERGEV